MLDIVASRLGMTRGRGGRWSPCPRCGTTGDRDGRPTVLLREGRGWYCVSCRSGGPDATSMASWMLAKKGRPTSEVLEFLQAEVGGLPSLPAGAPSPPVRIDPSPALAKAKRIRDVYDTRLAAWLEARKISTLAPAGWLPRFTARWWPNPETWPLVLPACTGTGKIESIHGICVDGTAPHKTTWPRGAEARELLFAAPRVRSWLCGAAPPPSDVLIVEGATDFLTATVELPECAVIGITAGSATALRLVPRAKKQRWYVATDPDEAGDKYARKVAEAVFPTPVYPFPLRG